MRGVEGEGRSTSPGGAPWMNALNASFLADMVTLRGWAQMSVCLSL